METLLATQLSCAVISSAKERLRVEEIIFLEEE